MSKAKPVSLQGRVVASPAPQGGHRLCLEVSQATVRGLYAGLAEASTVLPSVRAHITIMSSHELARVGGADAIPERGRTLGFKLGSIKSVRGAHGSDTRRLWLIKCWSPDLRHLRENHGLSALPAAGYFRIVFAVQPSNNARFKKQSAPSALRSMAIPALAAGTAGLATDVLRHYRQKKQQKDRKFSARNAVLAAVLGSGLGKMYHTRSQRFQAPSEPVAPELVPDAQSGARAVPAAKTQMAPDKLQAYRMFRAERVMEILVARGRQQQQATPHTTPDTYLSVDEVADFIDDNPKILDLKSERLAQVTNDYGLARLMGNTPSTATAHALGTQRVPDVPTSWNDRAEGSPLAQRQQQLQAEDYTQRVHMPGPLEQPALYTALPAAGAVGSILSSARPEVMSVRRPVATAQAIERAVRSMSPAQLARSGLGGALRLGSGMFGGLAGEAVGDYLMSAAGVRPGDTSMTFRKPWGGDAVASQQGFGRGLSYEAGAGGANALTRRLLGVAAPRVPITPGAAATGAVAPGSFAAQMYLASLAGGGAQEVGRMLGDPEGYDRYVRGSWEDASRNPYTAQSVASRLLTPTQMMRETATAPIVAGESWRTMAQPEDNTRLDTLMAQHRQRLRSEFEPWRARIAIDQQIDSLSSSVSPAERPEWVRTQRAHNRGESPSATAPGLWQRAGQRHAIARAGVQRTTPDYWSIDRMLATPAIARAHLASAADVARTAVNTASKPIRDFGNWLHTRYQR